MGSDERSFATLCPPSAEQRFLHDEVLESAGCSRMDVAGGGGDFEENANRFFRRRSLLRGSE